MDEQEAFARIGRLSVRLEQQDEAYTALLNLLAGVIGGKIEPGRVMVNLTERSWNLCPEGFSQGMPATINGLPNCVIAPAAPPETVGPFTTPGGEEVFVGGKGLTLLPVIAPAAKE